MSSVHIQQSIEVFSNGGVRNTQKQLRPVSFLEDNQQKSPPPARVMASQVCPVLSVLGSLSSLSSQGLAVGLGYTSLNPPLRSLPLCFSSLFWAAHTLAYTHLSFPWIHHPGLRSQERGWQGLEEPLILHHG